jgi:hypothetical protein
MNKSTDIVLFRFVFNQGKVKKYHQITQISLFQLIIFI